MTSEFDSIRVRAEQNGLFETNVIHACTAGSEALTAALAAAIRGRMAEDAGVERSISAAGIPAPICSIGAGRRRPSWPISRSSWPSACRISTAAIPPACSGACGCGPTSRPAGAINNSHAHPGVLWAAVYYVAAEAGSGGELFLEDPRFPVPQLTFPGFRAIGADGQPQEPIHKIAPAPGDLVLFPGWMRHGVHPHRGQRGPHLDRDEYLRQGGLTPDGQCVENQSVAATRGWRRPRRHTCRRRTPHPARRA
jgi:hypothetical protein